jgi:16S rRNA (guanine966-N2)-methyltransferase
MIITAGKLKGRKVKTLASNDVRPTSAIVRESVFNIVMLTEAGTIFYAGETRFLDLFAGSGVIGLEALSRGAREVVFTEKNPAAIKCLKQNLSIVEEQDKISLIAGDALKILDRFEEGSFNFIYIDPPYKAGLYEPVMLKIREKGILAKDGIIILEHAGSTDMSKIVQEWGFEVYKTKAYGDTGLTICRLL